MMSGVARATYDDVNLILRLYEMRRDDRLRDARKWFTGSFKVKTYEDFTALCPPGSEPNASYRMVTTYWEMAASFVTLGAIDAAMFHAANTEYLAIYAKLRPYLGEVRELAAYPTYLEHLERVVMSLPDAEARLAPIQRFLDRRKAEASPA